MIPISHTLGFLLTLPDILHSPSKAPCQLVRNLAQSAFTEHPWCTKHCVEHKQLWLVLPPREAKKISRNVQKWQKVGTIEQNTMISGNGWWAWRGEVRAHTMVGAPLVLEGGSREGDTQVRMGIGSPASLLTRPMGQCPLPCCAHLQFLRKLLLSL